MIGQIPLNCFANIVSFLPQDDKLSLTLVSKVLYGRTVPFLYRSLYLNERPYFPSDLDNSLGVRWLSLLRIPFLGSREQEAVEAKRYFKLLIRSLKSNVSLCRYIKTVFCSWHIDIDCLFELIDLLKNYGSTFQYFDNYLDVNVMKKVSGLANRLRSLNVAPPSKLPQGNATAEYYESINSLAQRYDWDLIKVLTLHVNASKFFFDVSKPLKINTLTINLRPDTFHQPISSSERPLYTIFDVDTLEKLRIFSWYKGDDRDLDLYKMWRLYDFHKFHNVRSLTLISLNANSEYLRACAQHFPKLQKIKVDFLFDTAINVSTLNAFRQAKCSKTLKYIDFKFEALDPPLLAIDSNYENFILTLMCRCDDCRQTFEKVILKKYFPSQDRLRIKSLSDVNSRNFIIQMFNLFPILPYTQFIDVSPAIAYHCCTLEDHASKVNELLRYKPSSGMAITVQDVKSLYHAHIHSLKKTFDHFISSFQHLDFLTLNGLPTRVVRFDDQQRCNFPLFYSQDYTSNQRYVLVKDESLFD